MNGHNFDNSTDARATIRTVAVDSSADLDAGTFSFIITGLTNTTDDDTYNYEIGLQATTSVKTSAMSSGSQAVQASDRLAKVTSMSVFTGISMGNYVNQGVLRFTGAVSPSVAQQYYWKAFPKDTSEADMIANSKSNPATWSQAEVFDDSDVYNAHINGLDLDKTYRFAVVPATIAKGRSHISIEKLDAALSGLPGTAGIAIEIKSGIDISNGLDPMLDGDMSGNLQIRYTMTEAQFQALDNGSSLTDLYFDMSGSDSVSINDASMNVVGGKGASDLSSGVVNFSGLRHGVDYKVRVFTVNANGTSTGSAYTSTIQPSTMPRNLDLTAIPGNDATSPYLANGPKLFDINADASGNGALPLTFMFDVSGVDNSMKKDKLTKAQVNALPLALGKQYNIDVKVSNRNGEQDDATAITIHPSAPPSVKGTTFGETQIDISSASITEVKVNLANMQREDYGYGTKGAIVQLVHVSNNNGTEYASDEQVITSGDYNDDITFAIDAFVSGDHHTNFKLKITPFNSVYGSGYTVDGTAPEGYSITVRGLNTFTTPSFSVVTESADISALALASVANDKDKSLKFKWQSDKAGDKVELLVARAQLHTDNVNYTAAVYADYKLIGEMTTVKYDADIDSWMTYELSNNLVLADGSTMPIVNGDKYYFMVRDKDYPMRGELTSTGVPAGLPIISDMKLHDYTATNEDLVTFKINPNGAAISDVFVIDNLSTDKLTDLMEGNGNDIYTSTAIRGDVYVRVNQSNAAGLNYSSDAVSNNLYVNAVAGNDCGITVGTAVSSVTDQTGNLTPTAIYTAANTSLSALATIKTNASTKRNSIESQSNNIYGVNDTVTDKSPADLKYDAIFALHALADKAVTDTLTAKTRGLPYDVTTGTSNGKTAQLCLEEARILEQELNNMLVVS